MTSIPENKTVSDAVALFLQSGLEPGERNQETLLRFAGWFGRDRLLAELTPPEVQEYVESAASGLAGSMGRLKSFKDFLTFARKKNFINVNLSTHARLRRTHPRLKDNKKHSSVSIGDTFVQLTKEGYDQIRGRLERDKKDLVETVKDIQKAAADKDVRENAPLEAAREHQGQLMARIREDEETLAQARIISEDKLHNDSVIQGSRVSLKDLETGEDQQYLLVDPREANALNGRISTTSPVGQAMLNRREGEEIRVSAPRGVRSYLILRVE